MAAGGFHALALSKDGSVLAWGAANNVTNMPPGLTNIVAVAAGNSHSLVIQSLSPTPLIAPNIAGPAVGTNSITLQWTAPIYEAFQVQWITSFAPPIVWNTFTNIITSTNGTFTFTDDGSQSGGLGGPHFYRVLLLP